MSPIAPVHTTILRIKRKRTDEPLDALLIDGARKKSKVSGVFRFVETIEEQEFWEDPQRTKDLQTRISTLSRTTALDAGAKQIARPPPSQRPDDLGRRYTIVNGPSATRGPVTPPDAESSAIASINVGEDMDLKMYDAILETNSSERSPSSDPEIDAFLPLLQEYLRLNNTPTAPLVPSANLAAPTSHDDEYVWDVFYQRPLTLSEWVNFGNIATVNGVPAWAEGAMVDDSDTDSMRDDDDEDSNAEDFYQNDYPEEENHFSDSDGDSEYDKDEYSSEEYYDGPEDDEEHDWRD